MLIPLFPRESTKRRSKHVPRDMLPANWRTYPPPPETQVIGNQWVLDGRSVVLRVPSAIVDTESNFLLQPRSSRVPGDHDLDPHPLRIRLPPAVDSRRS